MHSLTWFVPLSFFLSFFLFLFLGASLLPPSGRLSFGFSSFFLFFLLVSHFVLRSSRDAANCEVELSRKHKWAEAAGERRTRHDTQDEVTLTYGGGGGRKLRKGAIPRGPQPP